MPTFLAQRSWLQWQVCSALKGIKQAGQLGLADPTSARPQTAHAGMSPPGMIGMSSGSNRHFLRDERFAIEPRERLISGDNSVLAPGMTNELEVRWILRTQLLIRSVDRVLAAAVRPHGMHRAAPASMPSSRDIQTARRGWIAVATRGLNASPLDLVNSRLSSGNSLRAMLPVTLLMR